MSAIASKAMFAVGRLVQSHATLVYTQTLKAAPCFLFVRHRTTKHWNPKWKKLRKEKVMKVKLPNFNQKPEDMTPEEQRSMMRERGLERPRVWNERPIYLSCTGGIFEPYVPPEGDGKFSAISTTGAKQKVEFVQKKGSSIMAVRKMRNYEEELNLKTFAEDAREIYIKAHEALNVKNKLELRQLVTERAYPEMLHNTHNKTIHWKFIQSLEPSRVVQARCTEVITKDNVFGQLTVRFHTQQVLAVYDRFGRLLHGSEFVTKDVIEYIVFEKHLSNQYGIWRLHDKIIPTWMPPKEPSRKTFVSKVGPIDPDEVNAVQTSA
ncbi:large ribosomal subunit protein mL45 [Neodiprion pinetum]|uniref:large ribosomal subunit protein mL45 n=1 Tax=Neodiprion pinetum TaxID=441929 RepID=UPI001ED8DB9F|nr:probable 39S ribosomal protein L45, mitochondrial [Neodiprion fabricii]XP_046488664.1 probable 39S ribosomal protein L45, mitochondrial [Neodiprion pinetum]XP_046625716.1 probable 39S ribosomal protein L45, mitochondrial [Neodiprion virginianus]